MASLEGDFYIERLCGMGKSFSEDDFNWFKSISHVFSREAAMMGSIAKYNGVEYIEKNPFQTNFHF